MHADVARALEQILDADTERHSELLAFHYARGGVWDRAMDHLRLAIQNAVALGATDTAQHYLRQSIDVLDKLKATAPTSGDKAEWKRERQRMVALLDESESIFA